MGWLVAIPLGSFTAGLVAFPHCALMCGPLFTLFSKSWLSYHSGRILGYSLLGGLLGAIGLGLDQTGLWVSLQHTSVLLIAVLFLSYAALRFLDFRLSWAVFLTAPLSRWMARLRGLRRPGLGIFFSGLISALLPCGVLLPVWALCAGSGSPVFGSFLAFFFVLGTIPGAFLFRWVLKQSWWKGIASRRAFRLASGLVLTALGLFVLSYRGVLSPSLVAASPDYSGPAVQCAPGLPVLK